MKHAHYHTGFSTIGFLWVITVIMIVVSVTLIVISYSRDRTEGAQIGTSLNQIEKAFKLSFHEWPTEESLQLGVNPSIQEIALSGIFNDTLRGIPTTLLNTMYYDNDSDVNTSHAYCTTIDRGKGVNILIAFDNIHTSKVAKEIDYLIDGSDGFNCGKVRAYGPYLLYLLQSDPSNFL